MKVAVGTDEGNACLIARKYNDCTARRKVYCSRSGPQEMEIKRFMEHLRDGVQMTETAAGR